MILSIEDREKLFNYQKKYQKAMDKAWQELIKVKKQIESKHRDLFELMRETRERENRLAEILKDILSDFGDYQ
jgi:hypothetical protein